MRDDKGQFSSPDDKQISEEMQKLLQEYITSLQQQKQDTAQSTIETRKREVRYWFAFCESNGINPLAATTSDVRGYLQTITHLSDTTVGSYYRSVQSFYSIVSNDQANDKLELGHGHPCGNNEINLRDDYRIFESSAEYRRQHHVSADEIDGARNTDNDVLALKPDAVRQLFNNAPGARRETQLRNEIAIRLNWYTGCRSVELSRLRVENVDWDACTINVKSAKLNPDQHPSLIRRDVCFPEKFKIQLKRWCTDVRHSHSTYADRESGAILVTTHSDSMQPAHINDIVKEAARNAEIQRPLRPPSPAHNEDIEEWLVTTHRIRRSAISYWVNDCAEIDLHQARRLAGHANIEQTMDYVEPDPQQLAKDYQQAMNS